MQRIDENYRKIIEYVDSQKWRYKEKEDSHIVELGMNVKGKLQNCRVIIQAKEDAIFCVAVPPLKASADNRDNVVEFITRANYGLLNGCFEFDYSDGEVRYRSFLPTEAGPPAVEDVERIVDVTYFMVQLYGDGLVKNIMGFGNPEQDIEEIESAVRNRNSSTIN